MSAFDFKFALTFNGSTELTFAPAIRRQHGRSYKPLVKRNGHAVLRRRLPELPPL